MAEWTFFTNHARALVCIARDPGVRLREIAAVLDVTERRAFGIVTDLTEAGYAAKGEGRPSQSLPHPGPLTPAHNDRSTAERSARC